MTCIIGYTDGTNVYMAGDECASAGDYSTVISFSKVFKKSTPCGTEVLIGYTHTFRMGQVLEYDFELPNIAGKDLQEWLCTDFIKALQGVFKSAGIVADNNGVLEGGTFLIGLCGRLFTVQSDFSVVEHAESYDAVGSGCWEALAVMYALQELQIPGQEALPKALAAAAKFNSGVVCGDVVRVFKA